LPPGTVLAERYELVEVLGRGGFGIAYLARDTARRDEAVIKELAPAGFPRRDQGLIDLDGRGEAGAQRLRQQFLREARLLARLHLPGVLPVRSTFVENGTAYFATDYLPLARTLERVLVEEGELEAARAEALMFRLAETLELVHERGLLHRDLKPSNILLNSQDMPYLLDFGSAREWHVDSALSQTVTHTPGYAPPEQLSERARRGPATDVYGLCATIFHILTGSPPPPAQDRMAGTDLPSLQELRPDVPFPLAEAVSRGLEIRYFDRPQSMAELRQILEEAPAPGGLADLEGLGLKVAQVENFSFERRACPACGGLLENVRPLKRGICPICRTGAIRLREIHERLCPCCGTGTLRRIDNGDKLAFCPVCRFGRLAYRRKGLLRGPQSIECERCEAEFALDRGELRVTRSPDDESRLGESRTSEEWRELAGRSAEVWQCDSCSAQYDTLADGRRRQMDPAPKAFDALYPDEWARVAVGLEPGAGNAECDDCGADYFLDGDRVTLLSGEAELSPFVREFEGRLLDLEAMRWLAVGKESPNPGLVCDLCGTELDTDGNYLRLIRTANRPLGRHLGEPKSLEDWHRIAQGLPQVGEETLLREQLALALRTAYLNGEVGFDDRPDLIWKGPAIRENDGGKGTLTIGLDEILFGGMLRKDRHPFDAVVEAHGEANRLQLRFSGEEGPQTFTIEPVELVAELASGSHGVELDAAALAERINGTLGRR
jgi:hypothetical protein